MLDRIAEHPGRLMSELDGRLLRTPEGTWRLSVFDVSLHAGLRWVQLTLEGEPSHVLTLRLAPDQGTPQVLEALAGYLRHPLTMGEILNVGVPVGGAKRRPRSD
jgi:hypothetical protein